MKIAEKSDKALVLDILYQAFADNPSVLHTTKSKGKKPKEIRWLLSYCFDICRRSGYILLNDDDTACALVRYPDENIPFLLKCFWEIQLLVHCIGIKNAPKVLRKERQLKMRRPKNGYHYLWYIGTLPEHCHQGKGSRLLKEILGQAASNNCTVYLETSVDKNVRWYEKQGFEIYDKWQFDHALFAMRWPSKAGQ